MDKIGQWRSIEPAETGASAEPAAEKPAEGTSTRGSWRMALAAFIGFVVLAAAGLALWATTPQPQLLFGAADAASPFDDIEGTDGPAIGTDTPEELIVDVQGAVMERGLHRLPAGSRVGDAIAAAGGYSSQIDIRAAAERLNLAERLTDGAKINVPVRGQEAAAAAPTVGAPDGGGSAATEPPAETGLIEINTASQAQLETLPGIGPVTATEIIVAREQTPFTSVDELLGRGVVGPATFEKIRQLVIVAP
jgi:competence protein ComEA